MRPSNLLHPTLNTAFLLLALSGCGTAPLAPRNNLPDSGQYGTSHVSHSQARDAAIYAIGLVGTPYRYGGNTPAAGFDCSGLIGHVFRVNAGVSLPRTVARLQSWGQAIPRADLRSGDLVLFGRTNSPTHAGIYVGGGRFVHAPSTGGQVRLDLLDAKHWASQPSSFRRP